MLANLNLELQQSNGNLIALRQQLEQFMEELWGASVSESSGSSPAPAHPGQIGNLSDTIQYNAGLSAEVFNTFMQIKSRLVGDDDPIKLGSASAPKKVLF